MTDHAKAIRDALMWAQAYAPDRLAHRLIDAEESLRELLAGHAAEVEQLKANLRAATDLVISANKIMPGFASAFMPAILSDTEEARSEAQELRENLDAATQRLRDGADYVVALSNRAYDAERERDEARAEAERQRIRYGSFLDWAIGFVVVAVEADEEVGRPWLERMEHRLREERAALAAAQEPPAEGAAT